MQSDSDLYRRWLDARDEQAFADLARRHANLVFDVAWRTGGDPHLAEDALQDALLRLATDGTARPVVVGLRAWLARLAVSKALNARASTRARTKRERKVGRERTETGMADEATGLQAEVAAALERCHRDDAALLSLRYLHGLAYGEVAAVLGVAEPTARVRVHRALRRLRKRLRRDDVDEKRLAGLIAAVPAHAPSTVVLESVIAAAVDGTAAATVAATATVASWVPRALAVAGLTLLAAGSAGLLWWAAVAGRSDGTPPEAERLALPKDEGESTLRGRGVLVPDVAPDDAPTREEQPPMPVPGKAPPAPGPARERPRDDGTIPLRARLLLVLGDGTEEAIAIEYIVHRGHTWPGSALQTHPDQVRVRPGDYVALSTKDERAAFGCVLAPVPDPPVDLVLRIPARGTFEDRLALEVVDAETGLPLPDAWLEWGSGGGAPIRVAADRNGRIPVEIPDGASWAEDGQPVLWRFGCAERVVHAPGYRAVGDPWGTKEYVPAVFADHLASWMERGVRVVELEPLSKDGTLTERRVQILDADGLPAAQAYVLVSLPAPRERPFLGPFHDGFRRADDDGCIRIPVQRVVGLDVRIDRVPVAAWGLAEERWPEEGPRVLRLPALAEAELVVEGLPENAGRWTRDLLGPKRTPMDGPSFAADYDPEARALLEEQGAVLFAVVGDMAYGDLSAPHTTIRLPLAVGVKATLHLFAGHEHRTLTVQPNEPGPFREARSWDELPQAE